MSPKLAALGVAAVLAAASEAQARPPLKLTGWDQTAVNNAVAGATRRLETPQCQAVLDDFKDRNGRVLKENLEERGMSAAEYLRLIPFLDGSSHKLCRQTKVALVTDVGISRVFVCKTFAAFRNQNPGVAESMVIHELLHTLGLGENPPTSLAITQRVEARCR
jgi:hypothetical protein